MRHGNDSIAPGANRSYPAILEVGELGAKRAAEERRFDDIKLPGISNGIDTEDHQR
jgi:hypothetical protein